VVGSAARAKARSKKKEEDWHQLLGVWLLFFVVLGIILLIDHWYKSQLEPKHPVFDD
jgi:hypothetical protein